MLKEYEPREDPDATQPIARIDNRIGVTSMSAYPLRDLVDRLERPNADHVSTPAGEAGYDDRLLSKRTRIAAGLTLAAITAAGLIGVAVEQGPFFAQSHSVSVNPGLPPETSSIDSPTSVVILPPPTSEVSIPSVRPPVVVETTTSQTPISELPPVIEPPVSTTTSTTTHTTTPETSTPVSTSSSERSTTSSTTSQPTTTATP